MKVGIKVRRKQNTNLEAIKKSLVEQARSTVLRHALGATQVAYDIYPVGPEAPHIRDGTPHTRDTFEIQMNGMTIASQGQFWSAVATEVASGKQFSIRLLAGGAAFFVELGTINMEPRPILRMIVKQAHADISKDLRALNVAASKL